MFAKTEASLLQELAQCAAEPNGAKDSRSSRTSERGISSVAPTSNGGRFGHRFGELSIRPNPGPIV